MMDGTRSVGAVSSAAPEASDAGRQVLERGGNAVDAAVATALALGAAEPGGSGLGGQTSMLVHAPGEPATFIDGSSYCPRHAHGSTLSQIAGRRATTVPTSLITLETAFQRLGSGKVSWRQIVEPAIAIAKTGYRPGPFRRGALVRFERAVKLDAGAHALLYPHGSVSPEGASYPMPALAATLSEIADRGSDSFYKGDIAKAIDRDMRAHDGFLTFEDLASVKSPRILPALTRTYRGLTISTTAPPASGWVVLEALRYLERAPLEALDTPGPKRTAWLASALIHAHRKRRSRPIADLSIADREVQARLSDDDAIRQADAFALLVRGETTHLSTADGNGMVVALTQSLNSFFGSKCASPELGVLYNDYMREFVLGGERPTLELAPGQPPYSSMAATTVADARGPMLALGSPGDERIISAVVQVLSHAVDTRSGIAAAVAAPRLHTLGGGEALLETSLATTDHTAALSALGFIVATVPNGATPAGAPYFGGVHAVERAPHGWTGAADPRRDGAVS